MGFEIVFVQKIRLEMVHKRDKLITVHTVMHLLQPKCIFCVCFCLTPGLLKSEDWLLCSSLLSSLALGLALEMEI